MSARHVAVALALTLVGSAAWAQVVLGTGIGDPCADYDAGAYAPLAIPVDGGPAEPAPICPGQRAPAAGVFLTVDRAAALSAERTELREERDLYKKTLQESASASITPKWVPWVLVVLGAGSAAFSVYAAVKKK